MSYKILESIVEFEHKEVSRVIVLVDMNLDLSDVRAIEMGNKPCPGYGNIMEVSHSMGILMQHVAGYGCERDDRDKLFPGWKKSTLQNIKLTAMGTRFNISQSSEAESLCKDIQERMYSLNLSRLACEVERKGNRATGLLIQCNILLDNIDILKSMIQDLKKISEGRYIESHHNFKRKGEQF